MGRKCLTHGEFMAHRLGMDKPAMKGFYYIISCEPVMEPILPGGSRWGTLYTRFFGGDGNFTTSDLDSAAAFTPEAAAEFFARRDTHCAFLVPCGVVQALKREDQRRVHWTVENQGIMYQAAAAAHLETLRVLRQLRDEILVLQDPEIYDDTCPLRSCMIEADLVLDGQSKGLGQCEGCDLAGGGKPCGE